MATSSSCPSSLTTVKVVWSELLLMYLTTYLMQAVEWLMTSMFTWAFITRSKYGLYGMIHRLSSFRWSSSLPPRGLVLKPPYLGSRRRYRGYPRSDTAVYAASYEQVHVYI